MAAKDNITAIGRKHIYYPSMLLKSEYDELTSLLKKEYEALWGDKFLEETDG